MKQYFEETGSSDLPKPTIRKRQTIRGSEEIQLAWGDLSADAEEYVQSDGIIDPESEYDHINVTCNTKKNARTRTLRYSAGIFLGMYPCGIIPLFSQLYGSESVSQVHGICSNFFSANNHRIRKLIYDDACHLYKYSHKHQRMAYSDGCRFMGQLDMKVDRLHLRNHTETWCKRHMNPNKDPDLLNVNTVVVEQSFKHFNKYKNVKTMNEPRFMMMFLYMIDLHNLDRVGLLGLQVNPQFVPDIEMQEPLPQNASPPAPANVQEEPNVNKAEENTKPYQCNECEMRFKSNHGLTRHSNQKHPKVNNNDEKNKCQNCKTSFSSKSTLNRHKRQTKCKD